MTQEATNNVLVIKNARLSFPDIWTPTDFKGNKQFNYRATLLIPKTDAVTLSAIDKIMLELCNDKFGSKKGGAAPIIVAIKTQSNKCCLSDGNTKAYDGYAEHMALAAIRTTQSGPPLIVGRYNDPATSKLEVLKQEGGRPYGGCYVNAKVSFWAQDNEYGQAFRCTLETLQFVKDGDQFSGSGPATEAGMEELPPEESLV